MTLDEYLDRARARQSFTSDRQLSDALRLSHQVVSFYRSKRQWPSDATMIRLAQLAEISPEIALCDLAAWRTEGAARAAWERVRALAETATRSVAVLIVALAATTWCGGTHAEQINAGAPEACIMRHLGVSGEPDPSRLLCRLLWVFHGNSR